MDKGIGQRNTARITRATFKSFVNKNRARLLIRCESHFDGMTDGVEHSRNPSFGTAKPPIEGSFGVRPENENTLGIAGVWLVGSSRDYFTPFEEGSLHGIHVYNCCGSFTVAVQN